MIKKGLHLAGLTFAYHVIQFRVSEYCFSCAIFGENLLSFGECNTLDPCNAIVLDKNYVFPVTSLKDFYFNSALNIHSRTNPVGIYMFKVNNRNTREMCEICSKCFYC